MSDHAQQVRILRVGILTIATLAVVGITVVSIGTTQGAFAKKVRYKTYFKDIGGLSEGAPVKLAGVPVGKVSDINFSSDMGRSDIEIELTVVKRKSIRIRVGTKATMKSLSLLSGEKYIELSPGDPTQPALPPDAQIPTDEKSGDIAGLSTAATDVAAEIVKIADNLNKILTSINSGEGILGKVVADPSFGKETLTALQQSMESLRDVLDGVRQGQGAAGRLLVDQEYGAKLTRELDGAATSLHSILAKIDSGDGTAGQIVNDSESGKAIVKNLAEITETLKAILGEIKSGQGLAAKLVYDKEYGDRVSKDLAETVANLKSITRKIDRGDGTMAKVLNDPGLYASVHDIVDGIDKSKIVGGVLRHYQKKGLENRAKKAAGSKGADAAKEELEKEYGEDLDKPKE
ncbi:MAG: MlaD family protein [Acidobacteriota bacterium]